MSHYVKLDALILSRLTARPLPLMYINAGIVREECDRLGEAMVREPYRVLDGRLQALRKQGRITFNFETGWAGTGPTGEGSGSESSG